MTNNTPTLSGKVAFIQGGSRGIGAAIAIKLKSILEIKILRFNIRKRNSARESFNIGVRIKCLCDLVLILFTEK